MKESDSVLEERVARNVCIHRVVSWHNIKSFRLNSFVVHPLDFTGGCMSAFYELELRTASLRSEFLNKGQAAVRVGRPAFLNAADFPEVP